MPVTMELFHGDSPIFTSNSHWLYPLFEAQDFLKDKNIPSGELFLKDRIAGRAAAGIMLLMGIKRCHIGVLSRPAQALYERHGMAYSYDTLVDRIDCRTEEWIKDHWSLQEIGHFIRKRAGRVRGKAIELKNLQLEMAGRSLFKGLNLSMQAGDTLAIRGANGTGKTTLLRSILGLHPLEGGQVFLDGQALHRKGADQPVFGYLPQQQPQSNFPLSAGEVAQMGLVKQKLSAKDARYSWEIALRQTGAFHLKDQPWQSLSGGEKQRISLARCLCQNASVLLIDEPTSYLDEESKESLLDLLKQLVLDITPTILLVSHDLEWLDRLGWPVKELKDGTLC